MTIKKKIPFFGILLFVPVLLSGCAIQRGFVFSDKTQTRSLSKNETVNAAVTALNASTDVGNVTVSYGGGDKITVDATFKLSGGKQQDLGEILDAADVRLDQSDNTMNITVINKNTNEDFWKWVKSKNVNSLSASLKISIPKNISNFTITSDVGNVDLESPAGVVDVRTDTGNITVNNPSFSGKNSLQSDVGNISCLFNKAQNSDSSLSVVTDVGNVKVSTVAGVKAAGEEGSDHFTGSTSQVTVDHGFTIDVTTQVGRVTVS